MSYNGVRNWPPVWVWIGGKEEKKKISGEVGILLDTIFPKGEPKNRCYVMMEYDDAVYIGVLNFDDVVFCRQVYSLLQGCIRRRIEQIGGAKI